MALGGLAELRCVLHLKPRRLEVKLGRSLVHHSFVVVEGRAARVPCVSQLLRTPARTRRPLGRRFGPMFGSLPTLLGARRRPFVRPLSHRQILRVELEKLWKNSSMALTEDVHHSLFEESRRIREQSERVLRDLAETLERIRERRRRDLERTTAVVDAMPGPHPVMTSRLERLSRNVGRSPVIEEAKTLLAEEYGITRGEAFELLTRLSSHSNRKLRDVAEQLVRPQRSSARRAPSAR